MCQANPHEENMYGVFLNRLCIVFLLLLSWLLLLQQCSKLWEYTTTLGWNQLWRIFLISIPLRIHEKFIQYQHHSYWILSLGFKWVIDLCKICLISLCFCRMLEFHKKFCYGLELLGKFTVNVINRKSNKKRIFLK